MAGAPYVGATARTYRLATRSWAWNDSRRQGRVQFTAPSAHPAGARDRGSGLPPPTPSANRSAGPVIISGARGIDIAAVLDCDGAGRQAPSAKRQAPSAKRQAPSAKRGAPSEGRYAAVGSCGIGTAASEPASRRAARGPTKRCETALPCGRRISRSDGSTLSSAQDVELARQSPNQVRRRHHRKTQVRLVAATVG
jgi:hypothetical protein